ncbi:hypothetical protein ACFX1X_013543 [Malus domestica]
MVATQYSSVIKVLHSDNGGEYVNSKLSSFFRDQGILHETTFPYTSQQNGMAERKNRHILETTRALLIGASVPKSFWPDAVTYAVYVINRMPSRVVEFFTPLQVLTEHVLVVFTNTLTPRVFGCVAYVHIHKIHCSKLDPCALRCVFLGFASQQKGYKCYHPETRNMYVTMDVTLSLNLSIFILSYSHHSIPRESVFCNLDGVFRRLDVQDVRPLKGDDNTVPMEEARSQLLPPEYDIDGQPLIVTEETCNETLCAVSGVQPAAIEAELALPQAFVEASSHEIYAKASPLSLARSCHHPIRLL